MPNVGTSRAVPFLAGSPAARRTRATSSGGETTVTRSGATPAARSARRGASPNATTRDARASNAASSPRGGEEPSSNQSRTTGTFPPALRALSRET